MLNGLPDVLIAVVIVLVLSASMSTLSSLVLASSSTLTLDLIKNHVIKNMTDKKQVFVMRALIVVFIAISAFIAINKDKLSAIAQMKERSPKAVFTKPRFLPTTADTRTITAITISHIYA